MITIKFKFQGENYEFTREVGNFDRNYDDEGYALIYLDYGLDRFFEINVLKDDEGHITEKAYIAVYHHEDDNRPYCYVEDVLVYLQSEEDTESVERAKQKRINDILTAWKKMQDWTKQEVKTHFVDGKDCYVMNNTGLYIDNTGNIFFGKTNNWGFENWLAHGDYLYKLCSSNYENCNKDIHNPRIEKILLSKALEQISYRKRFMGLLRTWNKMKEEIHSELDAVSKVENFEI